MVDSPFASVLTKADLEGEAMRRAARDDPGEMTAFDRDVLGRQKFVRIEVPISANRFKLRAAAGLVRAWCERIDAATRRGDLSDRSLAFEAIALTRVLQETLRPSRARKMMEDGE